jgi:hypothetical protein
MRKEADINFSGNHRPLRGERPPDHASTHKFLSDAKSAKLELSFVDLTSLLKSPS